MKKLLFFLLFSYTLQTNAQNYLISFAGTGGSNTISSVKVENLTKGTSLILNGSDMLSLSGITGISKFENTKSSELKIYPNPMSDKSTLEILPPLAGDAIISVYEITGKIVTQIKSFLENSIQTFTLSGFRNGLYIINVKGNTYELSGKLLCLGLSYGKANIKMTNDNLQKVEDKKLTINTKGIQSTVVMEYSIGDRLKFTGISGIYSTVLVDIPSSNKTITFNFIACTDGDNNNYPVIQIGTQIWMAENLKTTTYNEGTLIPNVTADATWSFATTGAYSDYANTSSNSTTYGRLYNWYAVDNNATTKVASNGGKNVCPIGWHVPTDTEWTTLTTLLGGESVAGGKLKETGITHWTIPNTGATNETGFTALPSGYRYVDGTYNYFGSYGFWWSCTEYSTTKAWSKIISYDILDVNSSYGNKPYGFSVRCLKEAGSPIAPSLITTPASSITQTTATSGGEVTSDGGAAVTARGLCWSTSANPTIALPTKTSDGTGTGVFTSSLTGLTANTTYYVRAYATNSVGTAYGTQQSFTTTSSGTTVTDIDGNIYNTVTIGTQIWMAGNLKTTKYNDGTSIPNITDNTSWAALTTGAYCDYANTPSNSTTYGRLYNWYTVDNNATTKVASNGGKNVCPTGWHVSSDAEWTTLTTYLGGESVAGGKLKETGITHWTTPNTGATNGTGFTALPGGYRNNDGAYDYIGYYGSWWSSTEVSTTYVWYRSMDYNDTYVNRHSYSRESGFSVRCLKDAASPAVPTIITTPVSSITQTTATSGGEVTSDGGAAVTARGVCWNTSANPTIALPTKTSDGTGTGVFTSSLTGLTANTTYYVRTYATNSVGTAYGTQQSFTTTSSGTTITDIDGNIYNTVTIGTQIWMAGNLKTTKYNDGTSIPNITDNSSWAALTTGAYCDYANTPSNSTIYGKLYNWYVVDNNAATKVASNGGKNACPTGWHVPTDAEWTTLTTYLGGESVAGGKLKETGITHWTTPNTGATNEVGFSALPSGDRGPSGTFGRIVQNGDWWSSNENTTIDAWLRNVGYNYTNVYRINNSKPNGFSIRCLQDAVSPVVPTILTTPASSITQTTATSGGEVTSDGGAAVIARGVCWSTSANPTIALPTKTSDGTGTGVFTSSLTGLTANTTYYVRAYATNSVGTAYGTQQSFTTTSGTTVTDIDGNIYNTVTIGTQIWMAENLKTTKYNDGTSIPNITDEGVWNTLTTGAFCWNNFDANNKAIYGALYNWFSVVDSRKLCPVGWHTPTDSEWTTMVTYLGGSSVAGGKLKATWLWDSPNAGASNISGFTALPGGFLIPNSGFLRVGVAGYWWSATEYSNLAWIRYITNYDSSVYRDYEGPGGGFSVRCVKD